jgi:hypothetical protein
MRQIVHPSTYQDEDASPNSTTHHITTRNVYIHTLQSSASMQPGVHHKGIFLELELSRGHGYQSRLTTKAFIYSRSGLLEFLMFRERIAQMNGENQHTAPLSRTKGRGGTKHWDFPFLSLFITLVYL